MSSAFDVIDHLDSCNFLNIKIEFTKSEEVFAVFSDGKVKSVTVGDFAAFLEMKSAFCGCLQKIEKYLIKSR